MDLSTLSPMILDSGIMTPLSPEWTSGVVRNRKDKSKVAVGNGDYFGLPLAPVQNGGPIAPSPSGLRILIAEDNKINQQLIQRLLARKGHIVTMCNDGVEALEAFGSSPAAFDAVLSDIQMPRMGGIQLATEIRKKEAEAGSRRVPLLALTAHALERDREACFAAGFDEWLTKPLNQADLFKYLDRLPRRNTGAEKEPRTDLKTELKTDPVVGNSQS
jgi:CheY-like chemotaxis protein